MSAFANATVIHIFSHSSVEEKSRSVLSSDIMGHPTWLPCPIHCLGSISSRYEPTSSWKCVGPNPLGELDLECFPKEGALSNPKARPNRQFLSHEIQQRTWKLPTTLQRHFILRVSECWGSAGAELVEALCYKPQVHRFNSRWYHWNFLHT